MNSGMRLSIILTIGIGLIFLSPPAVGEERVTKVTYRGLEIPLTGKLQMIEEVPVLTVWGTPWQQGFAHGYLLCDTFLYREVLENAHAASAIEDVSRVLKERFTITGNSMMVTRPTLDGGFGGVVFEHDGCREITDGLTVRTPADETPYIVATNTFYKREAGLSDGFSPCSRFKKLDRQLKEFHENSADESMTIEDVWRLAGSAPLKTCVTYHRVVFEPDKLLMHVAFPATGDDGKRITLDVGALMMREEAR